MTRITCKWHWLTTWQTLGWDMPPNWKEMMLTIAFCLQQYFTVFYCVHCEHDSLSKCLCFNFQYFQVQICISWNIFSLVNTISHVLCSVNVFMSFINISQKINARICHWKSQNVTVQQVYSRIDFHTLARDA